MKLNKLFLLIILSIIFLFIYSSIYFALRPKAVDDSIWIFNTPDETANYFFIERFVTESSLKYYEPLNKISGDLNLVHPRSTTVVDNNIVPGSFLGFIIIMGMIAKIFSSGIIPFIVPLFSIGAVVCFYLILKKIFSENVAFLSSVLLLITPAFWYYNSRSLFNNVLFIDFLIISVYILLKFFSSGKKRFLLLSGLLLGLTLSIRASDFVWVAIIYLAIFIYNKKKIFIREVIAFIAFAILAFSPVLYIQDKIFGSPFVTGYTPTIMDKFSSGGFYLNLLRQIFMPFGIHPMNAFSNFYHFYVAMFPFLFWPAFIGGILFVWLWRKDKLKLKEKYYFIIVLVVSAFVMVYYGSLTFFDNLMNVPLIGSSQTRYMLPIYILSLPLIAYLVNFIATTNYKLNTNLQIFLYTFLKKFLVIVFVVVFYLLSFNIVMFKGPESLNSVQNTVLSYHDVSKKVRSLTESDSVIITSYNDKLFFPERKIIFHWNEPRFLENISMIARGAPIYFYSIDWQNDINYVVDNSYLQEELIFEFSNGETLYKLQ